ncbi:MAG: hypothetical protein A2W19_09560 [Spirochaetes bacterium RBG_16_49_21]|nr:MAG: hypothetical protein A2W19_09560 [Spirochaetes bacterium RBG_16_49_21]
MNEEDILAGIAALRSGWRDSRDRRLFCKRELAAQGKDAAGVRHDGEYKRLKKTQRHYTKLIRRLERILNRKRARHEKKD